LYWPLEYWYMFMASEAEQGVNMQEPSMHWHF